MSVSMSTDWWRNNAEKFTNWWYDNAFRFGKEPKDDATSEAREIFRLYEVEVFVKRSIPWNEGFTLLNKIGGLANKNVLVCRDAQLLAAVVRHSKTVGGLWNTLTFICDNPREEKFAQGLVGANPTLYIDVVRVKDEKDFIPHLSAYADNYVKNFDAILANPPFDRKSVLEYKFIELMDQLLKPGGYVAMLTPTQCLQAGVGRGKEGRKFTLNLLRDNEVKFLKNFDRDDMKREMDAHIKLSLIVLHKNGIPTIQTYIPNPTMPVPKFKTASYMCGFDPPRKSVPQHRKGPPTNDQQISVLSSVSKDGSLTTFGSHIDLDMAKTKLDAARGKHVLQINIRLRGLIGNLPHLSYGLQNPFTNYVAGFLFDSETEARRAYDFFCSAQGQEYVALLEEHNDMNILDDIKHLCFEDLSTV